MSILHFIFHPPHHPPLPPTSSTIHLATAPPFPAHSLGRSAWTFPESGAILLEGSVARCVSEAHWLDEWAVLSETRLIFHVRPTTHHWAIRTHANSFEAPTSTQLPRHG